METTRKLAALAEDFVHIRSTAFNLERPLSPEQVKDAMVAFSNIATAHETLRLIERETKNHDDCDDENTEPTGRDAALEKLVTQFVTTYTGDPNTKCLAEDDLDYIGDTFYGMLFDQFLPADTH